MRSHPVVQVASVLGLLILAAAVALGVAMLAAILANRVLTATIGEEGIVAIDDTLLWRVMMGAIYLVGIVAGIVTFVFGFRRILARRRA